MFKRRSTKKKNNDQDKSFISYTTENSQDNEDEDNVEGLKIRRTPSPVYDPTEPMTVWKQLLTLPTDPQMNLRTELDDPWVLMVDYIPSLLKLCEWSLVYLLGSLGFSFVWLFCLTLVYHGLLTSKEKTRNGTKTSAKESSSQHEKEVLQNCQKSESLPSWVIFPDVDRVEWINVIIKKIWPNIGQISQQVAKLLVEPKINEILKRMSIKGVNLEALSNFKMKDVSLGSIPARVGGIRVYDRNTNRDEIVMDIEVIYAGDLKVKFSVQAMQCEINQVCFKATARLTIKPLLDVMPLIGGFELYLISMPSIDYNLGGMANFGEIPGISNMIRSVIDNIIKRGFVWPNRFSFFFPLDSIDQLKDQTFYMPRPQGILTVFVREAKDLMKKDKHLIGGKSDPYVVLSIGERKVSFLDQYVDSNVNPVWNYHTDFPIEEPTGLSLNLDVFDFDSGSEDDFLGNTSIELDCIVDSQNSSYERWIDLDNAKHGSVHVSCMWRPLLDNDTDISSARYVVSVYIDSCSNLAPGRSSSPSFRRCDMRVSSGGDGFPPSPRKSSLTEKLATYQTKPRGPPDCPVFREGHYLIIKEPEVETIWIQVVDHKTNNQLGKVGIKMSYITNLPGKQFSNMTWRLEGAGDEEASITLSTKLYQY